MKMGVLWGFHQCKYESKLTTSLNTLSLPVILSFMVKLPYGGVCSKDIYWKDAYWENTGHEWG